ncbi:UbiA family prenyltransferase [Methanocella arvoryzae]|nr:UbiA family prenyltransferase [Methanocella arvoryzae]
MMIINGDIINIPILGIAFLLTLIVYSYDRFSGLDEDRASNPERSELLMRKKKHYPYYLASCIGALALLVVFFSTTQLMSLAIFVAVLVSIGILYSVMLKNITKYVPAFKNLLVASEWGATIALLYGLSYNSYTSALTLTFTAFVFLKLFILTVFYDIKDIESDKKRRLKTVPVMLGYTNTLRFLTIMTILSWVILVMGTFLFNLPKLSLFLIPLSAFVFVAIGAMKSNGGKPSKYDLLVSLEYVVWPLGIVIVMAAGNILTYLSAVI